VNGGGGAQFSSADEAARVIREKLSYLETRWVKQRGCSWILVVF